MKTFRKGRLSPFPRFFVYAKMDIMKKLIITFLFTLLLFGCKESINTVPNKWQSVTYNSGSQVLNQKWDDIEIKFSPHYLDDQGVVLACDFEIKNGSSEIVTVSNDEVVLLKDGTPLLKSSKEIIKFSTSFMSSYTESLDKQYRTYDPFSTESKDKYEEKKKLDNQLDMILIKDSIEPMGVIRRYIIPSGHSAGNYMVILPVGEKRFEFSFTLK